MHLVRIFISKFIIHYDLLQMSLLFEISQVKLQISDENVRITKYNYFKPPYEINDQYTNLK